MRRKLIVGLMPTWAVVFLCCSTVQNKASLPNWESFDFAKQLVTAEQIQALPLADLMILRGIVFGKHGRVFHEESIQAYLNGRPWYKADEKFSNSRLNATERKNLDLIREMEARKHSQVEPGDLRFYQDRLITREMLGNHLLAELHIMQAEIEAIHGKRFDQEANLQQYFDDRYWYQPSDSYDSGVLSETERNNIALLATAQKEQRKLKLAPGDMLSYQNRSLSADLLEGLSLYELRLMRNEVYARRGRQFRTPWLAEYFSTQDWYKPFEDNREPQLSDIEKQNVDTIVAYENRLHEELSIKSVTKELLEGIFLEDASKLRHEIYARRGKVFKDRWLQKYFASFAWYKANPDFSDTMLSTIEKQNIATIQAYEKEAVSLVEG